MAVCRPERAGEELRTGGRPPRKFSRRPEKKVDPRQPGVGAPGGGSRRGCPAVPRMKPREARPWVHSEPGAPRRRPSWSTASLPCRLRSGSSLKTPQSLTVYCVSPWVYPADSTVSHGRPRPPPGGPGIKAPPGPESSGSGAGGGQFSRRKRRGSGPGGRGSSGPVGPPGFPGVLRLGREPGGDPERGGPDPDGGGGGRPPARVPGPRWSPPREAGEGQRCPKLWCGAVPLPFK